MAARTVREGFGRRFVVPSILGTVRAAQGGVSL